MPDYNALITEIFKKLQAKSWMVATAESCTGGLIAAQITEISGSSAYFDRGFVTYSNQAKMDMLGVSEKTLEEHGAVSAQTAQEMASGALTHSNADIAVSVTGIAGPTGGTDEKPVGLVYIGIATKNGANAHKYNFDGTRREVRTQTLNQALTLIINTL